jgi:hypothetical protein
MKSLTIRITLAFSLLSLATQAMAQIVANPGDNLQAKLDSAVNGTLTLGAGTFNVTGPLIVHTGTMIQGATNLASHVVFSLSGTNLYGFVIEGNAKNVTITGLDVYSSNGICKFGDGNGNSYSGIHLIANNFKYGDGTLPDGTLVFGIAGTNGCNDLEITWNCFHDSPNSVRNWEVWGEKNSHLDHNLFYNIDDGGHLVAASNTTFSYNYGSHLIRMGQEIQDFGAVGQNLIFDHDVFFDYFNAFNDSEGLSVCPQATTGVVVSNCFVSLDLLPGAGFGKMINGAAGGPNRFGYGIEMICPGGVLNNDTIVMAALSADASASGETTTVNNCTLYGGNNALWGVWGPDYGPNGQKGSFTFGAGSLANTVNATVSGAPSPPANTFAGPAIYAATDNGTLWTPNWTPTGAPPIDSATQHAAAPVTMPPATADPITSVTITHASGKMENVTP